MIGTRTKWPWNVPEVKLATSKFDILRTAIAAINVNELNRWFWGDDRLDLPIQRSQVAYPTLKTSWEYNKPIYLNIEYQILNSTLYE